MEGVLRPPEFTRGMVLLDKEKFKKTVKIVGVIVNGNAIGKLMKELKKHILCLKSMKSIRDYDTGRRLILLDPTKYSEIDATKSLLDEAKVFSDQDIEYTECEIDLGYDNWSAEEILKSVLPDHVPAVTGFCTVGHVAHLNLREAHTPFKSIIGQVLLDKHKNLESVVNKIDSIDNTYRNFAMEVLAGKEDMNVTIKENGCLFEFDFSKVYWNSRLGTEHSRIISKVTSETVVYDVFAGVGPFSVPTAKKLATVHCNDLNPHSYESLCNNLIKNKVKGTYRTYNMDGRRFIQEIVKPDIVSHLTDSKPLVVIMNLPALAITFLDAFIGLLRDETSTGTTTREPVMVHCYCFSKVLDGEYASDVAKRINQIGLAEGNVIEAEQCRRVRNVAPNKEMMCAEFPLGWDILTSNRFQDSVSPMCKKQKLDAP